MRQLGVSLAAINTNEMNIPVHLASDAHHPDKIISGLRYGMRTLREVGYRETNLYLDDTWHAVALQRPRLYVV